MSRQKIARHFSVYEIDVARNEIGIHDDGTESGEHPRDGADAFEEVPSCEADASVEFGTSCTAHAHDMGLGDDADEGVGGEEDDVEGVDLAWGNEAEHRRVLDGLVKARHAAHGPQGKGED